MSLYAFVLITVETNERKSTAKIGSDNFVRTSNKRLEIQLIYLSCPKTFEIQTC